MKAVQLVRYQQSIPDIMYVAYTCHNQFLCSFCISGQLLYKLQSTATECVVFFLSFCIKT